MNDLLRCLIREMAQAQTRKLGIPRLSKIDKLKELVSDPPEYAIRFTDYERPANDVTMTWDEGHGTFMFPLNPEVYSALIRDKIGFSSGNYAHIFRIPEHVLIVGDGRTDIGDDKVEELVREIVGRKKHHIYKRRNSYKEYDEEDADLDLGIEYAIGRDDRVDAISGIMKVYLKNKAKIGGNSSLFKLRQFFKLPAFSIALMNIGIDGFMDLGAGFIYKSNHSYENSQIIVTNPKALHWIETMNTRDLMSFRSVLKLSKPSSEEYYDELLRKYPEARGDDTFLRMLATENVTETKFRKILVHVEDNAEFIKTIWSIADGNNSDIVDVGCILYKLCWKCQHYAPHLLTVDRLKRIRKLVEGANKKYYGEFTTYLPDLWKRILEVT